MKAIEASNEKNHEVQPSSLQKGSDVNEKTIESNSQENLLVRSDHQLQKQDSINEGWHTQSNYFRELCFSP